MNRLIESLTERRADAQSQLDALMGENPTEAAILEQRIQTLSARIEAEKLGDAQFLGNGALDSLVEWRNRQANAR